MRDTPLIQLGAGALFAIAVAYYSGRQGTEVEAAAAANQRHQVPGELRTMNYAVNTDAAVACQRRRMVMAAVVVIGLYHTGAHHTPAADETHHHMAAAAVGLELHRHTALAAESSVTPLAAVAGAVHPVEKHPAEGEERTETLFVVAEAEAGAAPARCTVAVENGGYKRRCAWGQVLAAVFAPARARAHYVVLVALFGDDHFEETVAVSSLLNYFWWNRH
jgi:hypothetical protein